MPSLANMQAAFLTAMTEHRDTRIGSFLANDIGGPDVTTRLDIYRNNIVHALIRSLEGLYPSLCKLMGEGFFKRIAGDYARTHLPSHGRLVEYGLGFPDFIDGYEPAARFPWFSDVARLELAWHRAYIAPEAPILELQALVEVPPAQMDQIQLAVHPSCQWLASRYPVSSVWRIGLSGVEPDAPIEVEGGREWLMVIRPQTEVEVRTFGEAGYRFGRALGDGLPLSKALEAAGAIDAQFDLQAQLAGLFAGQTFSNYRVIS